MTYRATCKRNGMYSSPTAGMINFNEELSEPVYRLLSVNWDNFFAVQVTKILGEYAAKVQAALSLFNVGLGRKLALLGVDPERISMYQELSSTQLLTTRYAIDKNLTHQQLHFKKKLDTMIQQLQKEDIQNEQRAANRLITPEVQACMTSCYAHCGEECGSGCYQRYKHRGTVGLGTNELTQNEKSHVRVRLRTEADNVHEGRKRTSSWIAKLNHEYLHQSCRAPR
jgi:hypothetical protein